MRKIITPLTIIGCIFFMLMGIPFMLIGLGFNFVEKDFKENGVPVKAEITDIVVEIDSFGDATTTTYVSFEYGEYTYSMVDIGYNSSSMYEGQEIEIYFNPTTENIMYVEGNHIFVIVFTAIGAVFCFIAIAILITGIIIKKVTRPVQEYGIKYVGKVQQLEYVSGNYMNQFFMVHCTYSDNSGATQYVKSGSVMINPSWPLPLGSPIDIYVDPKKTSKYFVDVNTALNNIYMQPHMNYNNFNNNNINYN